MNDWSVKRIINTPFILTLNDLLIFLSYETDKSIRIVRYLFNSLHLDPLQEMEGGQTLFSYVFERGHSQHLDTLFQHLNNTILQPSHIDLHLLFHHTGGIKLSSLLFLKDIGWDLATLSIEGMSLPAYHLRICNDHYLRSKFKFYEIHHRLISLIES